MAQLLDQLDEDLEKLRIQYEKYFVGVEKTRPTRAHQQVERLLQRITSLHPTTTVLRFRLQGLRARWVTYRHHWNRILDQMEKGTFRRDLQRLARRQARATEEAEEAASAGRTPSTRAPAEKGSTLELPPGMSAQEARALFREYVLAKRAAGEPTEGLSYGKLVRKLAQEVPKLQARTGGARVRFAVSTEGGKVRLRASRIR